MKAVCPCCGKDKYITRGIDEISGASTYECVYCGCIFDIKIRKVPERWKAK